MIEDFRDDAGLNRRYDYHHSIRKENDSRLLSAKDATFGLTTTTGAQWGLTTMTYGSSLGGPSTTSRRDSSMEMSKMSARNVGVEMLSPYHRMSAAPRESTMRGERGFEEKLVSSDRKFGAREKAQASPLDESTYNTPYHKKAFMKYGVTPGSLFSEDTLGNLSTMVFSEDSAYTDATFVETMDRIDDEVENIEKLILSQQQKQELLRERIQARRRVDEVFPRDHQSHDDPVGEGRQQRREPLKEEMSHKFVDTIQDMMNNNVHRNADVVRPENKKEETFMTEDWKSYKPFFDMPPSLMHEKKQQASHYSGSTPFETSIDHINKTETSLASISVEDISGAYHIGSLDLNSEPAPASISEFQWDTDHPVKQRLTNPFDEDDVIVTEGDAYTDEIFHEDVSSVKNMLEQDELRFEPSILPEVENDFLVQKASKLPWMATVPDNAAKSLSTQNESFQSPGEFFARRSARLEELERSPSTPATAHAPSSEKKNPSTTHFDQQPSHEGLSTQNSFERYMDGQDLYHVLAEESAAAASQSAIRLSSSYSSRSSQDRFDFSIPQSRSEEEDRLTTTLFDAENEALEHDGSDAVTGSFMESYVLESDTHRLILSPAIVGIRKYVRVHVGHGDSVEFSFNLFQQTSIDAFDIERSCGSFLVLRLTPKVAGISLAKLMIRELSEREHRVIEVTCDACHPKFQIMPDISHMDLGNVVPSWQKRYPFSVRNLTSAATKMKILLTTRDERSLNYLQISDPRHFRKRSAGFDAFHETYSHLYEFTLTPHSVERIVLIFSSNEDEDASLYHDIWLSIGPQWADEGIDYNRSELEKTIYFRFMAGPGDITVSPDGEELHFDIMPLGHPAIRTLMITNQEGFSLRLIPEITGMGASEFIVVPSIVDIPPGESSTFEIRALARPLETTQIAMLRFIGANPNQAVYLISKPCEATTGGLVVVDTKVDMGDVVIGQSCTKRVRIANAGTKTVQMTIDLYPKTAFTLIRPSVESFRLDDLSEEDIEIAFTPSQQEETRGTLTIQDVSGAQQFTVDLVGRGVIPTKPVSSSPKNQPLPTSNKGDVLTMKPIDSSDVLESGSSTSVLTDSMLMSGGGMIEWYTYPRAIQFTYLNKPAYLSLSNTGHRDLCFSLVIPSSLVWVNDQSGKLVVPPRSFAQLKFLAKESTLSDKPVMIVMTMGHESRRIPVFISPKTSRRSKHSHSYHSTCGIWSSFSSLNSATLFHEASFPNPLTSSHTMCIYPLQLHFRDSLIRHATTDYVTIENRTEKIQRWCCIPIASAYVKQLLVSPSSSSSAAASSKTRTASGELIRKTEKEVFVLESRSGVLAPRSAIRIPVIYTPYVSGTYLQFFQVQTNDQVFRLEISGKAITVSDRMSRRVRIARPHFRRHLPD